MVWLHHFSRDCGEFFHVPPKCCLRDTSSGGYRGDALVSTETPCMHRIQLIRGILNSVNVTGSAKRGLIAFPIVCTWQPITSIVIKVPSWNPVTVYPYH